MLPSAERALTVVRNSTPAALVKRFADEGATIDEAHAEATELGGAVGPVDDGRLARRHLVG